MTQFLVAPIDKLVMWRTNTWKKYSSDDSNLFLRVHCDQLLITSENKVFESLNTKEKIKGIYKDDVLILIICGIAQNIRKIKFQIKTNATQCFKQLKKFFPVICFNSEQSKNVVTPPYRNVDEVISHALNSTVSASGTSVLPPSFNNFVKLTLLDPSFPKLVQEIKDILDNETNNN